MRYFATLYATPQTKAVVAALFVIDAEIRESAQSVNHDVAHTRLQWWRLEVDRLVNGTPQHPAARALNPVGESRRSQFSKLHELIAAADMDLARMTYVNTQELRAYCARSGGAICEVMATMLAGASLDDAARLAANQIGLAVRLTEIIRDARADAYGGRLYVPLDVLDQHGVTLDDFIASEYKMQTRDTLRCLHDIATVQMQAALSTISSHTRSYLRPLIVLGELHRRLLMRMAANEFRVASERLELGAIEKPWTAWRAARRAT